ncbi:hypothetical protein MUA48_07205 [Staphylococcus sp. IVB6238]|uniref:hypothetical protein n=1 Tax=Staphylococcus sp. IVB6238 TaxID=2989770 RepID=UPI0021CDECA1|nr:hypothetical protein [Staphylococcus sp. IVB6238]UXR73199.1 hypothetical protein MUA48_07205 [Staphylococcus sp. IVB6238]
MKRIGSLALATLLILSACNHDQQENQSSNNEHEKSKSTQHASKKPEKTSTNTEDVQKVESNNQATASNQNTTTIDVSNIKDRTTLESVIYGNYSEFDKIKAYNSAVANGVIPQGNVLEGPAWAAYESSLKVESGEEKSIYDYPPEDVDYIDDDFESTTEEQAADEQWIDDQVEWNQNADDYEDEMDENTSYE